jgi:hypothetical protein
MEFALVDSLVLLPPVLIAGLLALYRNNILCFWDCHPAGKAVVQSFHTLKSTALMLRNTASAILLVGKTSAALVLQTIRSTALMIFQTVTGSLVAIKTMIEDFALQIVARIQEILVTLSQSFNHSLVSVKMFSSMVFTNVHSTIMGFGNSTITRWNSFTNPVEKATSSLYLYSGLVAAIGVILLTWYYLSKNRTILPPSTLKELDVEPIPLEEKKQEKKPIRRRARKSQ